MNTQRPIVNPYLKPQQRLQKDGSQSTMGPQSQRRVSLEARKHRMQSDAGHRKKVRPGDQQTLDGQRAFDPLQDCKVCRAKHFGTPLPHRGHHKLCWNNRRTKGVTSEVSLKSIREAEQLRKHFAKPVSAQEKHSSRNNRAAAAAAFFAPRDAPTVAMQSTKNYNSDTPPTTTMTTSPKTQSVVSLIDANFLQKEVTSKVNSAKFCREHYNNRAPLAMVALAGIVVDTIIRPNNGALIRITLVV
jgi:hypothetical protein